MKRAPLQPLSANSSQLNSAGPRRASRAPARAGMKVAKPGDLKGLRRGPAKPQRKPARRECKISLKRDASSPVHAEGGAGARELSPAGRRAEAAAGVTFIKELIERERKLDEMSAREEPRQEAGAESVARTTRLRDEKGAYFGGMLPRLPSVDLAGLILPVNPAAAHSVPVGAATAESADALRVRIRLLTMEIAERHACGASHKDTMVMAKELIALKHRLQQQSGEWITKTSVIKPYPAAAPDSGATPAWRPPRPVQSPAALTKVLQRGVCVLRYQVAGPPQQVYLRVVGDHIAWVVGPSGATEAAWKDASRLRSLPIRDVRDVAEGKMAGAAWKTQRAAFAPADACLSVTTAGSFSLDLQAQSVIDREALVAALKATVAFHEG